MSKNYKIYQSNIILDNYSDFLSHSNHAYNNFLDIYKTKDSTWSYRDYNFFILSSSSILMYDLFRELRECIRDFIGNDKRLWINSWINYHPYENIKDLDYHDHGVEYHGYISVDPKKSETIFPNQNYTINNKPGQIYIGPGGTGYEHAVKTLEPYEGHRITIAFDIITKENENYSHENFIPLI
jgi:hypothetical protein